MGSRRRRSSRRAAGFGEAAQVLDAVAIRTEQRAVNLEGGRQPWSSDSVSTPMPRMSRLASSQSTAGLPNPGKRRTPYASTLR